MEIGDLQLFLAVAESGTISGAAAELHTVQSNVSTRLRALERRVGSPLFNRHARGVTLTSAGAILLPYAKSIVRLMHEGLNVVADVENPVGTLNIGAMETAAGWRLPSILAGFTDECPQVEVSLRTGPTEDLTRDVLDYRLDGAFVSGPIDLPDIISTTVFVEELVLVTRKASKESAGDIPNNVPDAAGAIPPPRKLLVFRYGCSYRQRLIDLVGDNSGRPLPIIEFGSLEGILGCIAAGMGVTLLPASVIRSSTLRGQLKLQKLDPAVARAETVFIRRADTPVGPAMSRFLAHLANAAVSVPSAIRSLERPA